jgi:hypothetical protein
MGNLVVHHEDSNSYVENWLVRGEYIWTQIFPAKAVTEVKIEYKSLTGGFYWGDFKISQTDNPITIEKEFSIDGKTLWLLPWNESYCFSQNTIDEIFQLSVNSNKKDAIVHWTRYVLVTARNWMGGSIREFNLTVDKINPKAVAAFCPLSENDNVIKISSTRYQIVLNDFIPRSNFSLLVIDLDSK